MSLRALAIGAILGALGGFEIGRSRSRLESGSSSDHCSDSWAASVGGPTCVRNVLTVAAAFSRAPGGAGTLASLR